MFQYFSVTNVNRCTTISHSYEAILSRRILVPNVNAIITLQAVTTTGPWIHSPVTAPEVVGACALTVNTIPLDNIATRARRDTTGSLGRA